MRTFFRVALAPGLIVVASVACGGRVDSYANPPLCNVGCGSSASQTPATLSGDTWTCPPTPNDCNGDDEFDSGFVECGPEPAIACLGVCGQYVAFECANGNWACPTLASGEPDCVDEDGGTLDSGIILPPPDDAGASCFGAPPNCAADCGTKPAICDEGAWVCEPFFIANCVNAPTPGVECGAGRCDPSMFCREDGDQIDANDDEPFVCVPYSASCASEQTCGCLLTEGAANCPPPLGAACSQDASGIELFCVAP